MMDTSTRQQGLWENKQVLLLEKYSSMVLKYNGMNIIEVNLLVFALPSCYPMLSIIDSMS